MIIKDLQLAFRLLLKDKQGSIIHLLGLSVGIAGFLFYCNSRIVRKKLRSFL